MEKDLNFIDLFAGCGGLSLGALNAGFKGVLAIEKQKNAFETLKHNLILSSALDTPKFNWPSDILLTNHDINDFLKNHESFLNKIKGDIDLIVGGPPCQGFSSAGKRIKNDPRNKLYKSYLNFVELVQPKIILIENVSGIASKFNNQGRSYKDNIIDRLKSDYYIDGKLLTADLFGVPQTRSRYFIIGFNKSHFKTKIDLNAVFEQIVVNARSFAENYQMNGKVFNIYGTKTYDAISDLDGAENNQNPIPYSDENSSYKKYQTFKYNTFRSDYQRLMRDRCQNEEVADSHRIGEHQPETIRKYSELIRLSNENPNRLGHKFSKDELQKVGWNSKKLIINVLKKNSYSPTITTCPFDYVHYNSPRILTVREFARLQSFPDWFEFKGVYALSGAHSFKTPRYSQIGNAVPPLMAESILRSLKKYITV